mgnify:CR=1 FL=1
MLRGFLRKRKAIVSLSRWYQVYNATLAASLLGAIIAGGSLGWTLIIITLANFLSLTFAYMINDVEDAKEDKLKGKINPVSNGSLTKKEGYIVSAVTLFLSLSLYLLVYYITNSFFIIPIALFSSLVHFLYSWRSIRLKAVPVVDVMCHMYMMGAYQYLLAFLAFRQVMDSNSWLWFFLVVSICGYGQMQNEIRDFEIDSKTRVRTTATILGKKLPIALAFCFILASGVIAVNALPPWRISCYS